MNVHPLPACLLFDHLFSPQPPMLGQEEQMDRQASLVGSHTLNTEHLICRSYAPLHFPPKAIRTAITNPNGNYI